MQQLKDNKIIFPNYWDQEKVVKAITTLDTFDLYEYFGCANAASFTRKMNPYFPERPKHVSFGKYLRDILAQEPKPKWKPGMSTTEFTDYELKTKKY
jgi:hypothetical protein